MSEEVLSSEEREELAECEHIIENRLKGQFEIGAALFAINASRLYRETHTTFDEYVAERWDIARATAYGYMDAAKTRANLAQHFETLPANEFQSRPLAKLSDEDQQMVWGEVIKAAGPGGQTPYKLVKGAVDDLLEARKVAAVDQEAAVELDPGDDQYRQGDPLQLIADLPEASCDLLLISELSGSTPETATTNLLDLLRVSLRVMKADHQVFVIVDQHDYRQLLDAAESLSYESGVPLIWVTNKERSISDWSAKISSRHILHLRQGSAGLITRIGNVISCDEEDFKRHADQRPLALVRALIEAATRPGETVLDPTAVAATANIAARQIGRACIGIVNNSDAYEAGIERLNEGKNFEDTESN